MQLFLANLYAERLAGGPTGPTDRQTPADHPAADPVPAGTQRSDRELVAAQRG
ncbi:MAG TPA: hypothetical protein VFR07_05420 [Mycobacteriales bacterium]|jgi:hypothetical protein|nr:hypothetical protein [Mycobacteriales bacterium]